MQPLETPLAPQPAFSWPLPHQSYTLWVEEEQAIIFSMWL